MQPIETIDLVRAWLKTKQRRYRILGGQENTLGVYRGHAQICMLEFDGTATIKCRLMEGMRTVDLHDPAAFDRLLILITCFEWLLTKMIEGEFDPIDIPFVLRNDAMWNLVIDGALADQKTDWRL